MKKPNILKTDSEAKKLFLHGMLDGQGWAMCSSTEHDSLL